jgi:hypothetical protein
MPAGPAVRFAVFGALVSRGAMVRIVADPSWLPRQVSLNGQ